MAEHLDAIGGSGGGETVGSAIYGRLRSDILFGHLAPGQRLRLDEASRRYGASVGTMRESLSRLASEGLVVAEGQRGFEVAPASPAEFREVAELRLLLEGHALGLSFATGDLEWEGRVVAAHHKLAVLESRMLSGQDDDLASLRQYDRAFHRALISACGSRVLAETYASVHDRYFRYLTLAVTFRGEVSVREHAELLDCALTRDAPRAADILKRHIGSCLDYATVDGASDWAPGQPLTTAPRPPGKARPRRRAAASSS
ncbi:MAG: GntR family transcriptional regulator [Methylobacteriaceae bacterium]|nr:GntR family transcriptional regulator [Methylobacteriaceae bacterium]